MLKPNPLSAVLHWAVNVVPCESFQTALFVSSLRTSSAPMGVIRKPLSFGESSPISG